MKKWFKLNYSSDKKRVQFSQESPVTIQDKHRGLPGHPAYTPSHTPTDRGSNLTPRSLTPTLPLQRGGSLDSSGLSSTRASYNSLPHSHTSSNSSSQQHTPHFYTSGPVVLGNTPPRKLSRSTTPTFPLEGSALADYFTNMDTTGSTNNNLSRKVKSRTPNGSLESYYLDSNVSSPRSGSGDIYRDQRQPLQNEPRFTAQNVDANIRGRNHGYYIKAAGLNEHEGNKENLKLVYDRSRMASPLNSAAASRDMSRQNSFGKGENRSRYRYRPKKRPAPRPPPGSNHFSAYNQQSSSYNSMDSRSSNGEVAMKVFRKKKKAPVPPFPVIRDTETPPTDRRSQKVENVYPIEPPVDYNKDEKMSNGGVTTDEEEEEGVDEQKMEVVSPPVPKLDLPPDINGNVEEVEEAEEQILNVIPMAPPPPPLPMPTHVPGTPVSTRSASPEPPPLPPKTEDETGGTEEPQPTEEAGDSSQEKSGGLHRMGTILRKDIEQAAQDMMKKHTEEPQILSEYKSAHQKFAEELHNAFQQRDDRLHSHTLNVRRVANKSTSKVYRATPPSSPRDPLAPDSPTKTEPSSPRDPVDELIGRAQAQAKQLEAEVAAREKLRKSARVHSGEWIPEIDLDDVFGADVKSPPEHYTARGGNYYIDTSADNSVPVTTPSQLRLYKNNKYAKPNRNSKTGSNLDKFRRSIGKAFGSIKGLNKKSSASHGEVNQRYRPEDGWQLLYTEECEAPPSGAIKIKRMEKQAAYAYNTEKGQLVYLPDFDRIIITQDGRRIRENELNRGGGGKSPGLNKSMPTFGKKERPSLEGLFESSVNSQLQKAEYERREMLLIEQQFAQVRNINKRLTGQGEKPHTHPGMLLVGKPWRSNPDLRAAGKASPGSPGAGFDPEVDGGVLSDSDLPLRTSSVRNHDISLSGKRKKKSKSKTKSSTTGDRVKSPRQKVLQKGLDYYARHHPAGGSRPTTPNPVYSSEDDDDEGYSRAPSHTSDPTSSDTASDKKKGGDSFGDSGIGQESLNSSASTASGAPMAAHVSQGLSTGPVYYTALPPGVVLTTQPPSYPQYVQSPESFPAAPTTQAGVPPTTADTFPPQFGGVPVLFNSSNGSVVNSTPNGPFVYQTMYYPAGLQSLPHGHTLPHGTIMPPPTLLDNSNKYHSLPNQHGSKSANPLENLAVLNSDSNSTLVASNQELSGTLKSSENRSKVFNVNPNIALVSYSNNTLPSANTQNIPAATTSSNQFTPAQTSYNPAQTGLNGPNDNSDDLKRQFIMGPVGYRPVKFNPNGSKNMPLTMQLSKDENGNSNHVNPSPADQEQNQMDNSVNNNNGLPDEENNNNRDSVNKGVKDVSANQDNNNVKDESSKVTSVVNGVIPADIQNKYGHEDLIYL